MNFLKPLSYLHQDLKRFSASEEKSFFRLLFSIFNPRFTPVLILRLSRVFYLFSFVTKPFAFFLQWLNVFIFGIECSPKCDIGPGLFLPHTVGTVIGAYRIGKNATIFQGVTLGAKSPDFDFDANKRPILGDGVFLGSGAKVLGGIVVGDESYIGANVLLLQSTKPQSKVILSIDI